MSNFSGDRKFWDVTDPTPIGPNDESEYEPLELPRMPPIVTCGGCDGAGCEDCGWLGYFEAYPEDYRAD